MILQQLACTHYPSETILLLRGGNDREGLTKELITRMPLGEKSTYQNALFNSI